MNSDLYALIALAARYWFVALIAVLLFRGWRMTVADNRRAKLLREWMGQTGCVGELILNPGTKKHISYPIPREGVLGSGRAADVRIRSRDLKHAHAHFELREGGLLVKPLGRAELKVGGGFTGESVFLQDGDVLTIGKLQLMLVLFDASAEEEETDEWFEVGPDEAEPEENADEWYGEPPADMNPDDEDGRYKRPVRGRRPPDGEDEPYERPARARKVPVTLEGHLIEKPVRRKRKASAPVDLPFEGRPMTERRRAVPDDEDSMYETPAPQHAAKARSAKGARGKKAASGNSFDEDAIWRDL